MPEDLPKEIMFYPTISEIGIIPLKDFFGILQK